MQTLFKQTQHSSHPPLFQQSTQVPVSSH